jgi:uncharacterized protein
MQFTPSYLELGSSDPAKTSAFFSAAFGWPYNPMGPSGGWFDGPAMKAGLHGDDPAPQIYVYFAVDDLEEAIEKIRSSGGHADEPGPNEPGFGRFSNCKDPTGIAFGLHERPK